MKTLKKGFASRVLSLMLVAIMVISLGTVGITSISAAEVDTAQTGWDVNSQLYCYNSVDGKWSNDSSVKMTWQSYGFHQYTLSDVRTNQKIYFRIGVSDGQVMGANSSNELINPTYERDFAYTANFKGSYNWQIDLSNYSSKGDTVDVYIKLYTSYSGNSNVMVVYIGGGATETHTPGSNSEWYLSGSFNGWSTTKNRFVYDTDGKKVTTTLSLASGSYTFKIFDGSWYGADATLSPTPTASASTTMGTSDKNANLTINTLYPGDYKFTLDPSTKQITVSFVKAAFELSVDATVSDTEVFAGTPVDITASTNAGSATVTYTLKDSDGNTVGESNTTGLFTLDTSALSADTYEYTVVASATIEGETYTAESNEITIEVKAFTGFTITPTFPTAVEFGDYIDIKVTASTDYEVTYILKDSTGTEIGRNTQGVFSVATTAQDKDKTLSFTVEASTVVNNQTYNASADFSVKVNPISNTTTVNIYFKSTSTLGFAPIATVTGMYETLTDVKMTPETYIGSNKTNTADYWWYKIETKVSVTNPNISFSVKSSRYDMEATAYLTVVEGVTEYYFGIDNLYYTSETNDIVDLTNDEHKDFFQSAVHMVYDPAYDNEDTLAEVSASYVLVDIGDVNCDGVVNIKDATAIQKSLANLTTLSKAGNKVSDFDGDNAVTIKDATAIQKMLVASL